MESDTELLKLILLVIAILFFILKIIFRTDNGFSSSFYLIISTIIGIHLILLFTNIFYSAGKGNKYTCYYLLCNIIFIASIIIYILNTLDLTSVKSNATARLYDYRNGVRTDYIIYCFSL